MKALSDSTHKIRAQIAKAKDAIKKLPANHPQIDIHLDQLSNLQKKLREFTAKK